MNKKVLVIILISGIAISYFFLFQNKCEKVLKVYPEKGYCEFDLKTCEGLLGCKEYKRQQIPCGGKYTLCGEKGVCDCGE